MGLRIRERGGFAFEWMILCQILIDWAYIFSVVGLVITIIAKVVILLIETTMISTWKAYSSRENIVLLGDSSSKG